MRASSQVPASAVAFDCIRRSKGRLDFLESLIGTELSIVRHVCVGQIYMDFHSCLHLLSTLAIFFQFG